MVQLINRILDSYHLYIANDQLLFMKSETNMDIFTYHEILSTSGTFMKLMIDILF